MINKLKEKAYELKISDFGTVKARIFDELYLDLLCGGADSEKAEKMSNPFLYMKDAKTIIVCIFSYNTDGNGNISKYAFGKDYHSVIADKLKKFSVPITEKGYKCEFYADSWDLNERFLAVKAGLGFVGKNHLFISPKFGSFVFIGVILTDCILEETKQNGSECISCGRCIEACPGGAIGSDGGFDAERCISHITQKKGELNEYEEKLIRENGYIWGCDICQNVCPYNQKAPYTEIEEFLNDRIENLLIDENMSNREFRRKYSDRAFSWRGATPIKRNIKIINEM